MRLPKKEARSCKTQTNAATRKADLHVASATCKSCFVWFSLQTHVGIYRHYSSLTPTLHNLQDSEQEQRLQTPFFQT